MNKTIPTIFITIILSTIGFVQGTTTIQTEQGVNVAVPNENSYTECSPLVRKFAAYSIKVANDNNFLAKKFENLNLDNAVCTYSNAEKKNWFKMTVTQDNETCTLYAVAVVTNWKEPVNVKATKNHIAFFYEGTDAANKHFGGCKTESFANSKIHIDIDEEEVEEELSQEDTFGENQNDITFGPASILINGAPQEIKTEEIAAPEEIKIEEFAAPAEIKEEEVAAPGEIQEEQVRLPKLLGGWRDCNDSEKRKVPSVFAMLIAQDKFKSLPVYTENVVQCSAQLVNGMNYNVVVSFDEKVCRLSFHEEISGPISLIENHSNLQDIKECSQVLSKTH